MTTAILAAMHDEIGALLHDMGQSATVKTIGMREYHVGKLWGQDCVVVLARLGKVAAAATATTLIQDFGAQQIIFTGLAGGIAPQAKVGDVVVAKQLVQHDMDCRPFFPRHEIPLLGRSHFTADTALSARLSQAVRTYFAEDLHSAAAAGRIEAATLARFGVQQPQLHEGLIASGDQFLNSVAAVQTLREALPETLCVEMEGAAVAQICYEYGVPCAVLRTISDRADDNAHVDFLSFLREVASHYSYGIVRRFLMGN